MKLPLRLGFVMALLLALPARAQPCVACADESCPELSAYLPACEKPKPPVRLKPLVRPPAAPACPKGQERTEDTKGHCCWPGQAWSSRRSACVGTPTHCPDDMRVSGEACLAALVPLKKARKLTFCLGGFDTWTVACNTPEVRQRHRHWHMHDYVSDGTRCFQCWDELSDDCKTAFDLRWAWRGWKRVKQAECRKLPPAPVQIFEHVVRGESVLPKAKTATTP